MDELQNSIKLSLGAIQITIDEALAIKQYLEIIKDNPNIDLEKLKEIITDELDHLCIGLEMLKTYSGLEPKEYEVEKREE